MKRRLRSFIFILNIIVYEKLPVFRNIIAFQRKRKEGGKKNEDEKLDLDREVFPLR